MARKGTHSFLILDACVLIDYAEADPSVLGTVSTHVAPVVVVRPVFDEVEQLSESDALDLQLEIVDVEFDVASEASRGVGRLSFEDRLCLVLAKRHGWVCVTNDSALRGACSSEGIAVMWGLEMMAQAVAAGAMTADEAISIAELIHQQNPRFVSKKLVREFARKLGR